MGRYFLLVVVAECQINLIGVGPNLRLSAGQTMPMRLIAITGDLYRDEDIAPLRKKLTALSLPISHDNAFLLLGIDRNRIRNSHAVFESQTNTGANWPGPNTAHIWRWRLKTPQASDLGCEKRPFGPGTRQAA